MTSLKQSYWPASRELSLLDKTCGDVLREAVRARPGKISLIDGHRVPALRRSWTYAELLAASETVARALVSRFEPGTHIAVWSANSPEWIVLQFGLALAGMVLVTVNPALQPREVAYVLRQSRARAVFHQDTYRGLVMADAVEEACRSESLTLGPVVSTTRLAEFAQQNDRGATLPVVDSSVPAMIQYTSGTSGRPKGVMLSHYSVTNNSRIMAQLKEQDEQTVNLAVAPLFHTGGCVGSVLGTVQTLGTLLLPDAFDADFMLDLIEQERATYTFAVPTMLIALLEAQARKPRDLSSLRTIFSGGTVVPVEIVRRVEDRFGVRLIIGYGLTETSPAITHTRMDDSPEDISSTIGRAIPQVEVKIVDPLSGAIQPTDVPGELCTRGFHVMIGYYDMPRETAACIDSEGWLHTGDLCAMDARGYCQVKGRLKDMIIRGGENIYPREIEEVLYTHPGVAEVAVIGVPNDYWGEEVAAVVTRRLGMSVTSDELRAFAGVRLARQKVPRHWFALETLPMTASGKLQKFRLIEMYRDGELEAARI
ncbi:MAG: AMP-dependent synthetase [Proteobacteria bacterium]|nr:AMP-dependent synthetase [Pseudomonadota bacterium]